MITVVGLDGRPLADAARAALARAPVVVGGRRHLDAVAHLLPAAAAQRLLAGDLGALHGLPDAAVVLASGDPGFFGVVRRLAAERRPLRVLPAASSVAMAFGCAGVPWDDAVVVSAHGRDPTVAVNVCRRFPKVAVLTEPRFTAADLARALDGLGKRLLVAERLGTPEERVTTDVTEPADPHVVLVLDHAGAGGKSHCFPARRSPQRWALGDEAFAHRDGMVTKAEVRALALAWLGPGLGDLVWDVGAGSGSIAVECARLGAAVIAVEEDAEQCGRIAVNADRHGVPVAVVEGAAPAVLDDLPDPDAIFVGGGGAMVAEIAGIAGRRARRVVVVALATLERVGPAQRALSQAGLAVEATLLQASRLAPLGSGHRLAASNPVVLVGGFR